MFVDLGLWPEGWTWFLPFIFAGFFKKIAKKMGRVVTSKSKTTRGVLKVAVPVVGGVMLGGTALALFGAKSFMGNSESFTEEPPGESLEERLSQQDLFSKYGGFGGFARQGLFKLGRSAVKRVTETDGLPSKGDVAVAAGTGAATGGGMCAAPVIIEAVCKLCGG